MMMQLNPPIPLSTSRGDGWAHVLIDYGPEADLLWVVFLDADGACWAVPNREVRIKENWSLGRRPTPRPLQAARPVAAAPATGD